MFGIDDYDLSVDDTQLSIDSDFNIYPNPGNGSLEITSSKAHIDRVDVYDAQGKWINSLTTTQLEGKGNGSVSLLLKDVESGLYFIRISSSKGIETKRYELR